MNERKRMPLKILMLLLSFTLLLQGCSQKLVGRGNITELGAQPGSRLAENTEAQSGKTPGADNAGDGTKERNGVNSNDDTPDNGAQPDSTRQNPPPAIDLSEVKPDESGKVMVIMFHNFIEEYEKGDKLYTTTFDAFEKLLDTLYTSGYRLINLNDYLNGDIDTPAGCIPMVFTFDDGTAGQFNLIEENGALKVNPRSAAGIIEKFNERHPDFGIKGTFFVNLGNNTFNGAGTLTQRLEYLKSKGFEIGNHTYSHIKLNEVKTAEKIQEEIGGNQKKMYELIPGYTFTAFSLPYGLPSKSLVRYVAEGEYEGVKYKNLAVVEVGWDPNPSPFSPEFDPMSMHRVRSSGIEPVDADLAWWLKNLKKSRQYISDGNPDTVAVPEAKAGDVDQAKLGGRKLVTY